MSTGSSSVPFLLSRTVLDRRGTVAHQGPRRSAEVTQPSCTSFSTCLRVRYKVTGEAEVKGTFGAGQPGPPHLVLEQQPHGLSPAWTTFSASARPESADGPGRERSTLPLPCTRPGRHVHRCLQRGLRSGQHHRTADTAAKPTSKTPSPSGGVRRECTDRLLTFSRRHLKAVLRIYTDHFNGHRPPRSLGQRPHTSPARTDSHQQQRCHPPGAHLLSGVINEYRNTPHSDHHV